MSNSEPKMNGVKLNEQHGDPREGARCFVPAPQRAMIVLVGSSERAVPVKSRVFRTALRSAATAVLPTIRTMQASKSGLHEDVLLVRSLAQSLLLLVTPPVYGLNCLPLKSDLSPELELLLGDAPQTVWDQLHANVKIRALNKTEKWSNDQHEKIRLAELLYPTSQARDAAIEHFELAVERVSRMNLLHSGSCTESPKKAALPVAMISAPIPWDDTDPVLVFGKDGAFFGKESIHPKDWVSCMVTGETGGGKTASVAAPFLHAVLNYELADGTQPAVLCIDAKADLYSRIEDILRKKGELHRLVKIGGDTPPIRLFAGSAAALGPSERLSVVEKFGPAGMAAGEHAFWHANAMAVQRDLAWLNAEMFKRTGSRLYKMIMSELEIQGGEDDTSEWASLRALLMYTRRSRARLRNADEVLQRLCHDAGIRSPQVNVLTVFAPSDEMFAQWGYAVGSAEPLMNALANPEIGQFVDMSLIPDPMVPYTDVSQLIEDGKVIVFCPEPSREGQVIAAKALKTSFVSAMFTRKNMRRPVALVMDEAQTFISGGTGGDSEAGWIDRARSYRVISLFATQSISSLRHALGSTTAAYTAVEVLLACTPQKFFFRSLCPETRQYLRSSLPLSPDGGPHVIDARPPSGLSRGEAYVIWQDGSWTRDRANLAGLV
jgi:hypothetical protein